MPAFNCAAYIDATLASLTRQTLREWECICVDDGSTDDTASRLDAWATRDARIRVIHQSNAGVSAARNRGMDIARGDFLFFLDADDLVHPGALERLLSIARAERADVVVGGLVMIDHDCDSLPALLPQEASVKSYEAPMLPRLLSYRMLRFEAWGKLYARKCVAAARFPIDVACAEDTFFSLTAAAAARRIAVCPEPLYGYRRVPASASVNAASGRKYILGSVAVALHCHDLCAQQNVPWSTANRLITTYGTNRILTEVMRAAADPAVTTENFSHMRSEAVAGMRTVFGRTGRGLGVVALHHRATWLFTALVPSRAALSILWRVRNLRQAFTKGS
jgi:hypothetical protein